MHLIARSEAPTIEGQIRDALERVEGAYSLVIGVGRTLYAVVDPRGFRPLVLGRLGDGIVVASETCALDLVGATLIRELAARRVRAHRRGRRWKRWHPLPRQTVTPLRLRAGVLLPARQHDLRPLGGCRAPRNRAPARASSIPRLAPKSSSPCPTAPTPWPWAISEVSGIKLEHGLIRNHYVGRTFINPTQALRVAKVKIKFNPVREVIEGRSVVVVDDSLVRGTTSKGLVQMIRAAGATRSAPAARVAADHRAVPLRHRHAHAGGADRRHALDGGDPRLPRRRLPRVPVPRGHAGCRRTRHRVLPRLLLRAVPHAHPGANWCSSVTPLPSPPRSA